MDLIVDLLDNDLQKFLIGEILYNHPELGELEAEFELIDRAGKPLQLPSYLKQFDRLGRTYINCGYLQSLGFSSDYVKFINKNACKWIPQIIPHIHDGDRVTVKGKWSHITFWEVPLIYLETEARVQKQEQELDLDEYSSLVTGKVDYVNPAQIIEMGTRRRFSKVLQGKYLSSLGKLPNFLGTSNCLWAKEYGYKCWGSIGHELTQALSALLGPEHGILRALSLTKEQNKSNVCLPDTFTTDFFIKMVGEYIKEFVPRQDSGDHFKIGRKLIDWQKSYNISPSLIFSDSLNVKLIKELYTAFNKEADLKFGWGTDLSNCVSENKLVCKLKHIWKDDIKYDVIKLSDNPEKATGDIGEIKRVRDYVNKFIG